MARGSVHLAPARARLDRLRQPVARAGRARRRARSRPSIADHMRALGLDVELQEVEPGRPNVIGVLDGREPGPTLMFCGHIDTVGVEGMSAPFDAGRARRPAVRPRLAGHEGGRRGDDRRGARLAARTGFTRGRLIVAAVVDEEYASIGADALVDRVEGGPRGRDRADRPADRRGHKGFAWLEVETARPRGARQPAARRPRRDRAHGPGAAAARSARSRAAGAPAAPVMGTGVAARLDHRGRPGTEQLSRSLPAADGAANRGRRSREGRGAGGRRDPRRPARARIRNSKRRGAPDVRAARLRDSRRARAAATRSRAADRARPAASRRSA